MSQDNQLNPETHSRQEEPKLEIVFQPRTEPFVMDHPGGRLYRVGVTSPVNAVVRLMVEKVILDGFMIPNLYLRITNDHTGKKNQTELHKGVMVYWDVVEKFSNGGGIQLTHVMQGLPRDLGSEASFKIIASSDKGLSEAKWVTTKIDDHGELCFLLTDVSASDVATKEETIKKIRARLGELLARGRSLYEEDINIAWPRDVATHLIDWANEAEWVLRQWKGDDSYVELFRPQGGNERVLDLDTFPEATPEAIEVYGETHSFSVSDLVNGLESYLRSVNSPLRPPLRVFMNHRLAKLEEFIPEIK